MKEHEHAPEDKPETPNAAARLSGLQSVTVQTTKGNPNERTKVTDLLKQAYAAELETRP